MLITEVASPDSQKLLALSQFLSGRAKDTNSKKQISQAAFVKLANDLGVNITADTLADLISRPPLNAILEPLEPNSNVVKFKGNTEEVTGMSVDQARATVDANAKAAMKRRM